MKTFAIQAPVEALRLRLVRQRFPAVPVLDVEPHLAKLLADAVRGWTLRPGARIAVAVGSRGITQLAAMVRTAVEVLRAAGFRPFLLPAMGSHGQATPEGQLAILADYGVTPAALGIPAAAGMETAVLGQTPEGVPVHAATAARDAEGVLIINRVKPHTDFGGSLGSGLLKMAVVGVGKHAGALAFHRAAHRLGYEHALRRMAAVSLRHLPLLGGLAIVEGPRHETAAVHWVPVERMEAAEVALASEASRLMPRLPFDEVDVLIVDRIGKDISGTGMDPNVIGRTIHGYSLLEAAPRPTPFIRRILVRDLTAGSHGNATGIGMADFTTARLVRAMDRGSTYTNALTALSLQGSKIPIHFETDREAIGAALVSLGEDAVERARVLRIADTLNLEHLQVSAALAREAAGRPELEWLTDPAPFDFDVDGNLAPLPV